jgi:hypothetical protein
MEDEAYSIYEEHISAAEEASHKRTKKQQAKADKAEAQADAAAAEMEAKRQREAALDRNKDRLREENRELLTTRLEELLEAEAQMALERTRECVRPELMMLHLASVVFTSPRSAPCYFITSWPLTFASP